MSENKTLSLKEHKDEVDLALSMGFPQQLINNVLQILQIKWSTMPQLDLKGRTGSTDYIDFVQPKDMSHPVMWFKDAFDRVGILIRVKYLDGQRSVFSTFQRYTGKPKFVSCECHAHKYSQQLVNFCESQNHPKRCEKCKLMGYDLDVCLNQGLWNALAQNQYEGLPFVCLD